LTLFDLFFLVCALATIGTMAAIAVRAVRGRPTARLARAWLIGVAGYALVLLAVSWFTPTRYTDAGVPQCSDDWCLTLAGVITRDTRGEREYELQLDLSNRGLGRAQRERFVTVYLMGEDGRRYDAVADPKAVPFDTLVRAGQTIRAVRRVMAPLSARIAGMIVAREGGGRFPRCCIIGEDNSLGHAPTIVRLSAAPSGRARAARIGPQSVITPHADAEPVKRQRPRVFSRVIVHVPL
jgi:hypothetical protein